VQILPEQAWRARRAAHESTVDSLLAAHLDRARRGEEHPVEDFLFTYYSHRPARLRRWHPGVGTVLAGDAAEYAALPGYVTAPDGVTATARRPETVEWVRGLLAATAGRPAQLGCFGLHEWAMVYRSDEVRHSAVPLRLGGAGTDAVVESLPIRCSHFDAFRFFTPDARGLNVLQPTREAQPDLEQPGCLHATMDLYKWSYKLEPLTPSELLLDCFRLAKDVRELDMRASPYDLADRGYEPVRIETPEGRAEYAAAQRGFAERGQALRQRRVAVCEAAVEWSTGGWP
jgi:hypothetical protein